jgi:hypothetical protein
MNYLAKALNQSQPENGESQDYSQSEGRRDQLEGFCQSHEPGFP